MAVKIKLLIAIPSNTGRSSFEVPFSISLTKMVRKAPKHIDVEIKYFSGLAIDQIRNGIVSYAQEQEYTHLLFLVSVKFLNQPRVYHMLFPVL